MATRKNPKPKADEKDRVARMRRTEASIEAWARTDVGEAPLFQLLRLDSEERAECRDWLKSVPKACRELRQAYRFACAYNVRLGDGPEADEATGIDAIKEIETFTIAIVEEALAKDKKVLRQRPSDHGYADPPSKARTKPAEHDYGTLWRHVGDLAQHLEAELHTGRVQYRATRRAAEIIMSVRDPGADEAAIKVLHTDLYGRWRNLGRR